MTDFKDGDQVTFKGVDDITHIGTVGYHGTMVQIDGDMLGPIDGVTDLQLIEPQSEAVLRRLLNMAKAECNQWKENYEAARACIDRLEAAQVPRDTSKGEWPEEGQQVHYWDTENWEHYKFKSGTMLGGYLWLPAPPAPREA